jgi:spore coat polysaccharide biosynthesis protein SpsF
MNQQCSKRDNNNRLKLGIIIQARMNSQRLPGKVLRPMGGQPLIQYLIERIKTTPWPWMIATSDTADDQILVDFCRKHEYPYFRGSLHHVAQRFLDAAHSQNWDAFVRISGDSPLLDPHILTTVTLRFLEVQPDLATNVFPRSFPRGQSVEVVSVDCLQQRVADFTAPGDQEHVTPYFYRHSTQFHIENIGMHPSKSEIQLSVDTLADFEKTERLLAAMHHPHWQYSCEDILALLSSLS